MAKGSTDLFLLLALVVLAVALGLYYICLWENNQGYKAVLSPKKVDPRIEHLKVFGIFNTGNSCYISAALQLLYRAQKFIEMLSCRRKGELGQLLCALSGSLRKQNSSCEQIRKEIGKRIHRFRNYLQQDCSEFLMALLDLLKTENQEFYNLFAVKLAKEVRCAGGHCSCSSSEQCMLMLTLKPSHHSLRAGIQDYLAAEEIEHYYCEGCKAQGPAKLSSRFADYPDLLIVRLQSVVMQGSMLRKQESAHLPEQQLQLDEQEYRLVAMILHRGFASYGHFVAMRREEVGWLLIDDDEISLVEYKKKSLKKASPFLMLYQKI